MSSYKSVLLFIIIVAVVIGAVLAILFRKGAPDNTETEDENVAPDGEATEDEGVRYVKSTPPPTGILFSGYPGIDNDIAVAVSIVDDALCLESIETGAEVGRIPLKDIVKAALVDKSHEERRITPTGVFFFGFWATVFPSKVMVKSFFVRITWAFEGTQYETIISFDNAEWANGLIDALNAERAGLTI